MKTTKRFRLLTVFLTVVMLVALSINVYAAQSNAVTKDGLTAQLFTDKNAYKSGESVKASVQVDNQTGREVFIFAQINAPESVKLAGDTAAFDGLVADGATWTTPGGSVTAGAVSAVGSTATGDNMQAGFWVIMTALMVLGLVAMFVYGKNKKTWLSVLLCMVMIGGLCAGIVPVQAADMNGDIQLSCTIQVDGKDEELSAKVSYVIYDEAEEAAADEAAPTEPSEDDDNSTDSSEGTGDDNTGSDDEQEIVVEGYQIVAVSAIGDDGNKPINTYDGDYDTRWSYSGKGGWILYDLGETKNIGYMGIAFYLGDERISYFDVQASVDGETFFTVAESMESEMKLDMMGVDFGGIDARYIKVIGYGNTQGLWNSITEVGFYPVHESGEMVLPKAEKEETEPVVVPDEILEAIADLKTIYGDDAIGFLANLYDPQTGGFYYTVSARDTPGYLPNLESTGQILNLLAGFAETGKTLTDYMPEEVITKMVSWTQNLQNEADGYFYHPQWGKNVDNNRKGRDLSWALAILTRFDAKPLYPSALDRLTDTATVATAAETTGGSTLPSHLASEEAFMNWLKALSWEGKAAYSSGNSINAITSQIDAAGYTDIAIEYLNSIQNPATGLWGEGINYYTMSGAMKLCAIYKTAKTNFNHVEKLLNSVIETALSEEAPNQITFIYNPWVTIGSIRTLLEVCEREVPQWYTDTVYEKAPDMIRKTKEKLLIFKKDDGGFSYYPDVAPTVIQGPVPSSLGLAEGDVDATTIAINGCVRNIYTGLGIPFVAVYDADDLVHFMEIIQTVEPVIKGEVEKESGFDFEDGLPEEVKNSLIGGGSVSVEADPANADNHVLAFAQNGNNPTLTFNLSPSEVNKSVTVSFKLMLDNFTSKGKAMNISLGNSTENGSLAYQMRLASKLVDDIANFAVGDRRFRRGTASTAEWFNNSDAFLSQDSWHDFKVVYTPPVGDKSVEIKVYIDDELLTTTDKFYYESETITGKAKSYIDFLQIELQTDKEGIVYIDDVKIAETEEDSGTGEGETGGDAAEIPMTMDFEEGLPSNVTSSLNAGGSVSVTADPEGAENQVLAFTTKAGSKETVTLDLADSEAGKSVTVSFKLMMKNFEVNYNSIAVCLANQAGTVYQLAAMKQKDGSISIGDQLISSGTGSTPVWFEGGQGKSQGTWYDFKVVYTPPVDDKPVEIKVYIDGELLQTTNDRYYYEAAGVPGEPKSYIGELQIVSWEKTDGIVYIDDVKIAETVEDSDSDSDSTTSDSDSDSTTSDSDSDSTTSDSDSDNTTSDSDSDSTTSDSDTDSSDNTDEETPEPLLTVNFEDSTLPSNIVEFNAEKVDVSLVKDPSDEKNQVVALTNKSDNTVTFNLSPSEVDKSVTVSFKLMLDNFTSKGKAMNISLGNSTENGNLAYQMRLASKLVDNIGYFVVGDRRWRQDTAEWFKNGDAFLSQESWHDFKVVYTPPVGNELGDIKVYIDDELLTTTDKFYYEAKDTPGNAKSYIEFLKIELQTGTEGTVYIDDITICPIANSTEE